MRSSRRPITLAIVLVLAVCLILAVVSVAQARTVKQVNGTITGIVLNTVGKPVVGVTAEVWRATQPWYDSSGGIHQEWMPYQKTDGSFYTAKTNRSGAYSLSVPAGTYRIWFRPAAADLTKYCMEAYPDAPVPQQGTNVVVTTAKTTSRISVVLDGSPRRIFGYVSKVENESVVPWADMRVKLAIQGDGLINTSFGTAFTDSGGGYEFLGLKPYNWGAYVNGPEVYDAEWKEAWLLTADGYLNENLAAQLDAILERYDQLCVTGYLLERGTNTPLANVRVVAEYLDYYGEPYRDDDRSATTRIDGYFELRGLDLLAFRLYQEGDGLHWDGYLDGTFNRAPGGTIDIGTWYLPAPQP